MKKIIIFLFVITVVSIIKMNHNELLIPNEAFRIRVIANSNSIQDQEIKYQIKEEIINLLSKDIDKINTYKKAKLEVKNNIDNIKEIIENYTNNYNLSFGKNYFPKKEYKGVTYKEGIYDSLVITLGEGKGNNFWCVMYPPLCLIDDKVDNRTYALYINEIIKKMN